MVQGTWAKDAEGSIAYYSEVEDDQFNTTDIGVPNTERGTLSNLNTHIEPISLPELGGVR